MTVEEKLKEVVEALKGSLETAESCEGKVETYCKACVDEAIEALLEKVK